MEGFNDDEWNPGERIDDIVEAVEDAEHSAVAVNGGHEETSVDLEDISEAESQYWEALGEVNDTLRELENNKGMKKLPLYVEGEHNPDDLRFEGFTSGLGKVVEEYVTELANEIDYSGGHFDFQNDNGAAKSAMGYTLGAKPDEEITEFESLDEIPEGVLEEVGSLIDTVTESVAYDDKRQGKYMEAFRQYAETDKTQAEIADDIGIDKADMSRRKSAWEEEGLVEDREYTETGQVMAEMINEVYCAKE